MDEARHGTPEERIARLEAREAARGMIVMTFLMFGFAAYLLWSAGVLKFGGPPADA